MAREGARVRPPVPAPASLQRFLKFHKLPGNALVPVRRAVDSDDAFRRRVAALASEDNVGRAGWVWLTRPEGWEPELERLAIDAAAAQESDEAARAERDARKRVDAAEQAARQARAEAAATAAALGAEKARREAAEAALTKVERRVAQLEIELGGARRRVDQAAAETAEARAGWQQALDDAAAARAAADETAARLAAARQVGEDALTEVALLRQPVPAAPAAALAGAAAALLDAAEATSRLAAALAAAAGSLSADAGGSAPPMTPTPVRRVARPARPRRRPVPLPGGVFDDTVEAATHLVRVPGALVLVDGYNVAKLGWPALPLAEQRTRLLDALDEMAARFGTDVLVVFDGADVGAVPLGRRHLRVEFSKAGVTADDVIVDAVQTLPVDRPVVVATNDGDVRRRSRRSGANLVSSEQLLAVARRA